MPPEFARYSQAWRALHPHWSVVEWDGIESLRPLVNQALYDAAPAGDVHRWRADVVRLELLARYGGVYVDADIEPLRPIDHLVLGNACLLATSANRGPRGEAVVSNAFLAAPPRHPFILRAIRDLPRSAARFQGRPTARVTGPWHLQRVLAAWRREPQPGFTVIQMPAWTFYPQSNRDRDAGEAPDLTNAYGWHRWATSRGPRP
jgi:mannosyltransferase OCH1-like enzyme